MKSLILLVIPCLFAIHLNHKAPQTKTIKLKAHHKADPVELAAAASENETFSDPALLKSSNQYTL